MTAQLAFNVFTAPERALVGDQVRPFGPPLAWDPITSTLLFGTRDAVLVDVPPTIAQAEALAHWVALHDRDLETIYITHGHVDHFAGLSVLLDRFPRARAIATPEVVAHMGKQVAMLPFFREQSRTPLPDEVAIAEAYTDDTFELEGHELRIIEQGRTDTRDTTSLYVPAIDLVVAGDVVYNECHIYLGESNPESREHWVAALDGLAALEPKAVVAGHKKPSAPHTPAAIHETKRYLIEFDRLRAQVETDEELYHAMNRAYPDWVSPQPWLMFGLV